MTRRMFVGAFAALFRGRRTLMLEAIAAPVLPARMRIAAKWQPWFEIREYEGAAPNAARMLSVFERVGMDATPIGPAVFLIGFRNLEQRAQAWTRVNTDREWPAPGAVRLSIWRAIPG